jgi:hypothetical protein
MKSQFLKSEEVQELLKEINALFLNSRQAPEHTIIDDVDLCKMLHISPRTSSELRKKRKIAFKKDSGKIHYLLSDVLDYYHRYRKEAIDSLVFPIKNAAERKARKKRRA